MAQTTNNNILDNTSKTLSIQVSLSGLSFCSYNNSHVYALEQDNFGMQLTPKQTLERIKHAFEKLQFLNENFSSVEIIYQNELYTTVPKSLFDKKLLKEYLQYNIRVFENDFIAYDELSQHSINVVYVPYMNINNFFFDTFGSFTYQHSNTILLNSLLTKEKNNDTTTVYANINQNSFDLIIIKKGKLLLSNTYLYETKEDFLYYLMYAAEQLKLNPEEFNLIFYGNISKESDLYKIAYTYIRNVSFGSSLLHKSQKLTNFNIEPHQHFVLLSHF